jgi:hypothetical protein
MNLVYAGFTRPIYERTGEVWYRMTSHVVSAGVDEWDNPVGPGHVEVYVHEHDVIKHTPKGVWLNAYGEKKFVRRDARKRFACPTKEEALESFVARKKRQIGILSAQLRNAEDAIHKAQYKFGDPEKRKQKGLEWLASLE